MFPPNWFFFPLYLTLGRFAEAAILFLQKFICCLDKCSSSRTFRRGFQSGGCWVTYAETFWRKSFCCLGCFCLVGFYFVCFYPPFHFKALVSSQCITWRCPSYCVLLYWCAMCFHTLFGGWGFERICSVLVFCPFNFQLFLAMYYPCHCLAQARPSSPFLRSNFQSYLQTGCCHVFVIDEERLDNIFVIWTALSLESTVDFLMLESCVAFSHLLVHPSSNFFLPSSNINFIPSGLVRKRSLEILTYSVYLKYLSLWRYLVCFLPVD